MRLRLLHVLAFTAGVALAPAVERTVLAQGPFAAQIQAALRSIGFTPGGTGTFTGQVKAPAANNCALVPYSYTGDLDSGACSPTAGYTAISSDGVLYFAVGNDGSARLHGLAYLGWVAGADVTTSPDLRLSRVAADTLAQRRSTNTQQLEIGPASDYLRFTKGTSQGEILTIGGDLLKIGTAGAAVLTLKTGDTDRWTVDASGHLAAAGAYNLTVGGTTSTTALSLTGNGSLAVLGDGSWRFLDQAGTGWSGLTLGVADTTGVRIAKSAATVSLTLGDGTLFAPLRTGYIVEANTGTKGATTAESRELYSNTGDADGSIVNLPDDPVAGTQFAVAVIAAQTITINTGTGETIWLAGTSCGTDITGNDTGASLLIIAITGGSGAVWHAIGSGTWTC